MITPDPVGPGFEWAELSVNTIMVLLLPVSKMELMQHCTLLVFYNGTDNWSLVSGRVSKKFGMRNISKVAGVSFGRSNWLTLHFLVYGKNSKICLVRDLIIVEFFLSGIRFTHLCTYGLFFPFSCLQCIDDENLGGESFPCERLFFIYLSSKISRHVWVIWAPKIQPFSSNLREIQ